MVWSFVCSQENGPYLVGYDGDNHSPYLVANPHSWSQDSHLLYVDNPVGAGFSFTEDEEEGYAQSDEEVSYSLIVALNTFTKVWEIIC